MTVLTDTQREQVKRGLARYGDQGPTVISKSNLRLAVNATDDWINTNQAAFNSSLPAIAQSELTTEQKTLLFCAVAAIRVSPAFARKLFGEID